MKSIKTTVSIIALTAAMAFSVPSGAYAEDGDEYQFNIKSQLLTAAIKEFTQQTNSQILYSKKIIGLKTQGLSGKYNLQEGLSQLLKNMNLYLKRTDQNTYAIVEKSSNISEEGHQHIGYNTAAHYRANLGEYVDEGDLGEGVDIELDEIVVTASRREQVLQDVPASISVVNPQEFTNAGLSSLDDIIEYTPGFHVNAGTGQRGRGSISARSVGQIGPGPVVSVYVDDTPLSSNSGFASGGTLFYDGLLGDIERVELIKGPQGTLFGATAIGGAVRYITKKPALEEARGRVSANLSDTKHGGFTQVYSGNVSVPVVKNKLGISVAGFYEDNGGLIDRVDPTTGLVTIENADASETYGYSGDILLKASENFDIRMKFLHQKLTYNGTGSVNLADADKTPTFGELRTSTPFSDQSTKQTFASAAINYDFEWASLTATSSYAKYNLEQSSDLTASFAAFADTLLGRPIGTTTEVPFLTPKSSEKYIQEVRLTSDDSDSFEWILGLYYADETTTNSQLAIANPGEHLLADIALPSEYNEYAAFANLTYYITPNFDVGFGMRYADTQMDLNSTTTGPLVGESDTGGLPTANAKVKTYLFTARYRLDEDTSFYGRVASGYRPATANLPVLNLSQEIVEQDDLWSYEVGAKGSLSDDFLSYDIALWYLDWKNFQTFVNFFGLSTAGNAKGGITAKGFEASFTMKPVDGLNILSTVAYSDSSLNENEPELNGLKGQSVPTVPEWTATTRASYDYAVSGNITGSVSGGFRYVKGSRSSFADGDPGDATINLPSDSYVLADVAAGFYMDNISLNLYVTNLFDKEAYSSANASVIPNSTIFVAAGTPVTPRTIGAVLSYEF